MSNFDLPNEPPADQEGPSLRYALAHYALRYQALEKPLFYLAALASPKAGEFIASLLETCCENLECEADFSAESVKIHTVNVAHHPCVIVELPEPQQPAEAYFTALVAAIDLRQEERPSPDEVTGRYFTLEKGISLDGGERTVLAEWTESMHRNYGDGPEPRVDAFQKALGGYVT